MTKIGCADTRTPAHMHTCMCAYAKMAHKGHADPCRLRESVRSLIRTASWVDHKQTDGESVDVDHLIHNRLSCEGRCEEKRERSVSAPRRYV